MVDFTTDILIRTVTRRLQMTFKCFVEELAKKNKEVIDFPRFWKQYQGRITFRVNGEVVRGGFRNIKDTGALTNSLIVDIRGNNATITWSDPDAAKKYFGHINENGNLIPGRKWHKRAMKELGGEDGLRKLFLRCWERSLG